MRYFVQLYLQDRPNGAKTQKRVFVRNWFLIAFINLMSLLRKWGNELYKMQHIICLRRVRAPRRPIFVTYSLFNLIQAAKLNFQNRFWENTFFWFLVDISRRSHIMLQEIFSCKKHFFILGSLTPWMEGYKVFIFVALKGLIEVQLECSVVFSLYSFPY